MGRVKNSLIKRIARELFEKYKDEITGDFYKNKELLKDIIQVQSKKLRNQIIGYVTRLYHIEQDRMKRLEEELRSS